MSHQTSPTGTLSAHILNTVLSEATETFTLPCRKSVETKRASQSQKEEKAMMPSREENHGLTSTSHHASKQVSLLFLSWQIRNQPTRYTCVLRSTSLTTSLSAACQPTDGLQGE